MGLKRWSRKIMTMSDMHTFLQRSPLWRRRTHSMGCLLENCWREPTGTAVSPVLKFLTNMKLRLTSRIFQPHHILVLQTPVLMSLSWLKETLLLEMMAKMLTLAPATTACGKSGPMERFTFPTALPTTIVSIFIHFILFSPNSVINVVFCNSR